jgi:hypothetical protein
MAGEDTKTLYVLWHHVEANVPFLLQEVKTFFDKHEDADKHVILSELVMASSENKLAFQNDVNAAINKRDEAGQKAFQEILAAPIPQHQKMMITGLRELAQSGPASRHIDVQYIDGSGPEFAGRIRESLEALRDWSKAFGTVTGLPVDRVRTVEKITDESTDAERRTAAQRYLGAVAEVFSLRAAAAAQVLSSERNQTMVDQVAAVRASHDPETPVLVVTGAGHSDVAFRGLSQEGGAIRYIALSDSTTSKLPTGFLVHQPQSFPDLVAIQTTAGLDLDSGSMKRAMIQAVVEPYFEGKRLMDKEGGVSSTPGPHVDSVETMSLTLRTALILMDEDQVDTLLNTWLQEMFEPKNVASTAGQVGSAGQLLGQVTERYVDNFLLAGDPHSGKGLEGVFKKYLAV